MTSQKVIDALVCISSSHRGELRAADVVRAARPLNSPLHCKFNWDDGAAAHKYRLWQARQLIRVTIEYIGPEDDQTEVRVFVSLTTDRTNQAGGGYRRLVTVMSDRGQRAQLLADAFEEMRLFRAKYAMLKELAVVFEAMLALEKKKAR